MDTRTNPDRFIAVNILPTHYSRHTKPLEILKKQINFAIEMKFTHIWINPIFSTPSTKDSICHRRCSDTGIMTNLYSSLYAPNDITALRWDFDAIALNTILREAKEKNIHVLIDFVWKHLSTHSTIFNDNPKIKGKKINDINEYNFQSKEQLPAILERLQNAIDFYLDTNKGLGFAGLRIDAASHFIPEVRIPLYQYIKAKYPHAILFEESLFDRAQSEAIQKLATSAEEHQLFADFITGNLYYQKADDFGGLPSPGDMEDTVKLRIANNNSVSFTGNHDHYSAGWGIILGMAAKRLKADTAFAEFAYSNKTSPINNDALYPDVIKANIEKLAKNELLIESLESSQQDCIRYLLPYANEIARELLDTTHENHEKVFTAFKLDLLKRIADRTLASPSGYFILYSELFSPFETPRIFSNQQGDALPFLLLTVDDLKNQLDVTTKIIENIGKNKTKYNNFTNFSKSNLLSKQDKKSSKKDSQSAADKKLHHSLRSWLPFIIEYLRNNPEENKYTYYNRDNSAAINNLSKKLGLKEFILDINTLFAHLSTPKCIDYCTFLSLDKYKIIVRCTEATTDIIALNLNSNSIIPINELDIQKIAVWFQSKKFPPSHFVSFASPFHKEDIRYVPDGDYTQNWRAVCKERKEEGAFDNSYMRITGQKANHQTNLYLGRGFSCELPSDTQIKIVKHLKTDAQVENEIFHNNIDKPLVAATLPSLPTLIEDSLFAQPRTPNASAANIPAKSNGELARKTPK